MTSKRLVARACLGAILAVIVLFIAYAKSRGRRSRVYPRQVMAQQISGSSSVEQQRTNILKPAAPKTNRSVEKKRELSWKMPAAEGVNQDDAEVVDLAISTDGSRLLAKGKKLVCLFETGSTNALKMFGPLPSTDAVFLSADARVVAMAVPGGEGKSARMLFQDAETGRKLSAPELESDVQIDWALVSFSADGSELILPGRFRERYVVQIIPVAGGLKKLVELPVAGVNARLEMLAAIPGRQAFVACWNRDRLEEKKPSRVSILDLANATERVLPAIDIEPYRGMNDRRLWVSGDGNFVALSDIMKTERGVRNDRGSFAVADLTTGEVAMRQGENLVTFPNACFTPDGKRVVVKWAPHFETMYFNVLPTAPQRKSERPTTKLFLYEIASGKKLAEYSPPAGARALAVSADGKRVAFSSRAEVYVIGFREAFGRN